MLKAVLNISILTFSQHADVHSILICVGEGCPYQCLGLPCGLITFKHARAQYGMIDPEEPPHLVGIFPPHKIIPSTASILDMNRDRGYFA